jgi:hypothetical protein
VHVAERPAPGVEHVLVQTLSSASLGQLADRQAEARRGRQQCQQPPRPMESASRLGRSAP